MGSPPQVRGKHFFARHPQPPARITPAGAGKTYAFARGKAFRQDHPRRCGENVPLRQQRASCRGSPPQVRGKPDDDVYSRHKIRITPAGAGKTKPLSANAVTGYGSPPQVRGKLGVRQMFL